MSYNGNKHDDHPFLLHFYHIYSKAAERLYTLRVLKRVGVAGSSIIGVYKRSIRSILGYAVPVWQDIPEYLLAKLESIQKTVLKIVLPDCSYCEALIISDLESLEKSFSPHGDCALVMKL